MDTPINQESFPAWLVMWLLASGLFVLGKRLMLQRPEAHGLALERKMAFALLWVGMDIRPWAETSVHRQTRSNKWTVAKGVVAFLTGIWLLCSVARKFEAPLAQGWVGMIGLVLVLHFGSFALLAVFWNAIGVPVVPIMNQPSGALSLADFWGRRWNRAFRDLAHPLIFVPVARRYGQRAAGWAGFAISGFVHELVISVPAGAGYGLPTLYFLLQAMGFMLERKVNLGRSHLASRWLFTHAFTALPAFILFHPPFIERVMIPFLNVIGALP
jgi:hypothetical protein